MKTIIATLLILGLCISAAVAQPDALNDKSIKLFVDLFPQYKKIAEKYGENVSEENLIPEGLQFKEEMDVLCKKYGTSMEEFSLVMQKVTTGIALVKMKQSGMNDMFGGFNPFIASSEKDLEVIEAHLPEIEKVLEDNN